MGQRVVAMDVRMAAALAGAVPNVSEFCRIQGISRQTFYKWRRRFAAGGVAGLQERSRRPLRSPGRAPGEVEEAVVRLRKQLAEDGQDNGPDSIRWAMLARSGTGPGAAGVPSRAGIWRILTRRGLVVPAPAKRPKSSLHRFVYARPNECWQSDWTCWSLADGAPVAIAATLDDHSRFLGGLRAGHGDADAALVWATMTQAFGACGLPARSLSDNGLVYTGRRIRAAVAFETNLRALGVQVINSTPYHPQTCGKVERHWQTLKRWLRARDPARDLTELTELLADYRDFYNQRRPHRALGGATPAAVFAAAPKAGPATHPLPGPPIVTTARVVENGVLPIGPYNINVGRRFAGQQLDVIRDGHQITLFDGPRLVRQLTADPTRRYQPMTP